MVDFERAIMRLTSSCEDLAASRDRLAQELESALHSALKQIEMLDLVLQRKALPNPSAHHDARSNDTVE